MTERTVSGCWLIWLNKWWTYWLEKFTEPPVRLALNQPLCLPLHSPNIYLPPPPLSPALPRQADILNIQTKFSGWQQWGRFSIFRAIWLRRWHKSLFTTSTSETCTVSLSLSWSIYITSPPKDYTAYLKWYSIKYDCRNTEWSVLALDLAYAVKKKKKKTLYWN